MKAVYIVCMIALLSAIMVMPAAATTTTISPDKDSFIWQLSAFADRNYGIDPQLSVASQYAASPGPGELNKRTLIQFDLSSIPPGATIDSATLHLFMHVAPLTDRTIAIHRIAASWTEGTLLPASGVTWLTRDGTNAWATHGGDYVSTPSDSFSTGTTSEVWVEKDLTTDVQAFVDGTYPNDGWLIKDVAESSTVMKATKFASSEYDDDITKRPYLEVTYMEAAAPDLTPTAITPPSSIIANIPSTIGATINNTGASDAAAFDVMLSVNGTVVDTQTVSGLASEDSTAVSFSWTPAAAGDYSLTVTADSGDVIIESDETNNELSQVATAVSTGYMGGTLTTYAHDVVRGDLLYTIGNSTYRGSMPSGKTYTVEFNIMDIPAGAAVKTARLYSYWCYSYEEPSASMDVTFDGTLQTPDASYIDRKGYGSYDRPYGTYAYNVDLAGNDGYTATITNTGDKFSIYAMGLLVVYEDDGNEVEYWINEGADIINSNYGITPEQATTDAPFDGTVTLADVESARLITVVPSGDKGNNTLLFNTYTEAGIWNTPNIAVEERDITSYISSTGNLAQLRDDNADYMMPSGAFLVMQRFYVPPPTSSGVSLGATIRPAISIEVTPGTLDFGTLAPGQTSSEQTLGLSNTGGCNVSVTADVTDTADNLYVAGMLLDSGIWSSYSTEVAKSATDSVGAVLDVPDDYAGVGTQEGALIFWAEKA